MRGTVMACDCDRRIGPAVLASMLVAAPVRETPSIRAGQRADRRVVALKLQDGPSEPGAVHDVRVTPSWRAARVPLLMDVEQSVVPVAAAQPPRVDHVVAHALTSKKEQQPRPPPPMRRLPDAAESQQASAFQAVFPSVASARAACAVMSMRVGALAMTAGRGWRWQWHRTAD